MLVVYDSIRSGRTRTFITIITNYNKIIAASDAVTVHVALEYSPVGYGCCCANAHAFSHGHPNRIFNIHQPPSTRSYFPAITTIVAAANFLHLNSGCE